MATIWCNQCDIDTVTVQTFDVDTHIITISSARRVELTPRPVDVTLVIGEITSVGLAFHVPNGTFGIIQTFALI